VARAGVAPGRWPLPMPCRSRTNASASLPEITCSPGADVEAAAPVVDARHGYADLDAAERVGRQHDGPGAAGVQADEQFSPLRHPRPTTFRARKITNRERSFYGAASGRKRGVSFKLINTRNGMAGLPGGEVLLQVAVNPSDDVVTYGY
jgi:hypothetical protein